MNKLSPGGIFQREARWMLLIVVLPALVAFVFLIVVPWLARFLR